MQGLPIDDWQFWVVSLLALAAAFAVLRTVLPRKKRDSAACRGCPTAEGGDGSGAGSKPRRVELTIGGKRVRGS
jgi:hypothetical protein